MSEPYWVPLGGGTVVPPIVNGQWLNGVGGAAVWSPLTQVDVPVPLVTSLPGSPVDGQECILTDSLTNPSYTWHFHYVAASTSPYKWQFIGGSDVLVRVATAEGTTTTSTWVDLATVGPLFVLPRAGDYIAEGGAAGWHTTVTGAQAAAGVANGAGVPQDYGSLFSSQTGNPATIPPNPTLLAGCAAGSDIRLRYFTNTAGTCNFIRRWLRVRPVRVA